MFRSVWTALSSLVYQLSGAPTLRPRTELDSLAVAFVGEGSGKENIRLIAALLRCMGGVGVHLHAYSSRLRGESNGNFRGTD